ncbi:serine hydrolase domain-containing protein [Candidatus Bipolaricaulota bacterium]
MKRPSNLTTPVRSILFAVALLAAATAHASASSVPHNLVREIHALVTDYLNQDLTPGLVVGVRWGDATWVRGYGVTHAGTDRPMTADTRLYIGSLSKQFTAAGIMRLVEQRRLGLDWTIPRVFPEAPDHWAEITIHQLLNHTSGISSYGAIPYNLGQGVLPPRALLGFIAATDLFFEPGTAYVYSSPDYAVLGYIIEQVSGMTYGEYLERTFLSPLGLASSGYWIDDRPDGLAGNHMVYVGGEATFQPVVNVSLGLGSSSIHSTVGDLLAWQEALLTGRAVQPASLERMTEPVDVLGYDGEPLTEDYGYGLQLELADDGSLFGLGHGGINGGHIGWIWAYPTLDVGFVVLQNSDGMLLTLLDEIEEALLNAAQ